MAHLQVTAFDLLCGAPPQFLSNSSPHGRINLRWCSFNVFSCVMGIIPGHQIPQPGEFLIFRRYSRDLVGSIGPQCRPDGPIVPQRVVYES